MSSEVYELRINSATTTERQQNVLHFVGGNITGDDTFSNGKFLLDAWTTNIKAKWLACLPDNCWLESLQARRATPKPSVVRHSEFSINTEVGTFGSGMELDQLCPSVFLIPATGTKTGGKIFMPAASNGAILNNQYDAGYITAIDTLFNALLTNFGVSGKTWQLVVFSRKLATFSLVMGFSLSGRFGFQKRRRVPV